MKADSTSNTWRRFTSRETLFVLLLSNASAIFVLCLDVARFGWWKPERIVERLLTAFISSYCIGTLVGLALLRLAPRLAGKRFYVRWPIITVMIAFGAILGGCLAVFILIVLGIRPRDYRSWVEIPGDIFFTLLIALASGVSFYLYEILRGRLDETTLRLRTTELEKERARKLVAEARLASLESRIHPHFLFNTLNSISGLIQEDPAQAEQIVERLAALLRFSLDSSALRVVSLEQELKIATDYLEIERVRFGDRLRYAVEAPAELLEMEVPPLSLQTLVENSIKHVAAHRPRGVEIRIVAHGEKNFVHLEVHDDGPGLTRAAITPGHGLHNLSERLRALFGDEARLDLSSTIDNMSCVRVSLPIMAQASSDRLRDEGPVTQSLSA